jgi:hypothetical protein
MYFGMIEVTLASRLNIEKPAPRLMRSSSAIARKDHARPAEEPVAGSCFEVPQIVLD